MRTLLTFCNHCLQKWEAAFSKAGFGGFFTPCEYLKKRAAAGVELCAMPEQSKL